MAYHLFVDGLLQPAAYHGLFVSMPMAAHQTIFEVNAAAEALDVGNKPCVARAKTRKASGERRAPADPVIGAGLPVQRGSVEKKDHLQALETPFFVAKEVAEKSHQRQSRSRPDRKLALGISGRPFRHKTY